MSSNNTVIETPPDRSPRVTVDDGNSPVRIVPPFAATCRAVAMPGTGQYSRCLVDANTICWYRINRFNLGALCLHPRHPEIVTRTDGQVVARLFPGYTGDSLNRRRLERAKGIEPSCEAWKASVLPLNYARLRSALRNYGAASPRRAKRIITSRLALSIPRQ